MINWGYESIDKKVKEANALAAEFGLIFLIDEKGDIKVVKKPTDDSGLELVPSLAEGCSRHRSIHGKCKPVATSLVP